MRSSQFRRLVALELSPSHTVPAMELVLPYGSRDALQRWAELSPHPCILDVLAIEHDVVLLRYAALAWGRRSSNGQRTVANWGLQLIDAYRRIVDEVSEEVRGLFACPLLEIDAARQVRLSFPPVHHDNVAAYVAPELRKSWPRCDETALVYTVGAQLQQLSDVDDVTLATILQRARADRKGRRFKTLRELRDALAPFASKRAVRADEELIAWRLFEEGVGWLELEMPHTALERFEAARTYDNSLPMIAEGLDEARQRLGMGPVRTESLRLKRFQNIQTSPPPPSRSWGEVEREGLRLEDERSFALALSLYRTVDANDVALFVARARCHLYLEEPGPAIDFALRALALDPSIALAHDILVTAQLRRHMAADAFRSAERFVVQHPTSARAHYLLGKALFARGCLHDAHSAFEQAMKLDPKLLEAQLLRREVERVTGNLRQTVGKQNAPTFDMPEQLAELRDVLISGDTNAAITALRDDRYARDADARLLLARLLTFDARHDDAIAVYDELAATSHRTAALVGKAGALLELGRVGDALSIVEQLPGDGDAAELQARALEQLGRLDEAAEAYRRFIALASSGSDLRVRAAEIALDDIAARRRG